MLATCVPSDFTTIGNHRLDQSWLGYSLSRVAPPDCTPGSRQQLRSQRSDVVWDWESLRTSLGCTSYLQLAMLLDLQRLEDELVKLGGVAATLWLVSCSDCAEFEAAVGQLKFQWRFVKGDLRRPSHRRRAKQFVYCGNRADESVVGALKSSESSIVGLIGLMPRRLYELTDEPNIRLFDIDYDLHAIRQQVQPGDTGMMCNDQHESPVLRNLGG